MRSFRSILNKNETLNLFLWTLSYFKPFILSTIAFVLCGGIMILGEITIPRRMGYLIDNLSIFSNKERFVKEILILVVIIILIMIAKSIYYMLEQIITNKIIKNQQLDLINKLQTLGFSYYEKVPTGNILFIFENSVAQVQKTYNFLFPQFIYSLVQFTVPSIILIIQQPIFFFASMVGSVIYAVINKVANHKIQYHLDLETKADHIYQQSLYDSISATNELKVMGAENWFLEKTISNFNKFRIERMWSIFWRHYRFTSVGFSLTISMVLFYIFGLDLIKTGEITIGEFVGYSFFMGLMSRGFSVFFYIIPAQKHALKYAKYIYEFLHLEPDVKDCSTHTLNKDNLDITFTDVTFQHSKDVVVIDNTTFKIPQGKKVAFVGESGSGKSTILKLIGRFYDVTGGEIKIGDQNLKDLSLNNLRSNLSYVFQDTFLFNMSIKDNLRFGNLNTTDEEIIEACKASKAHEFIINLENGYDTIIGESGHDISGGQKQRLSIARMLLKNAPIVLLDEVTSALDNITEMEVKKSLDELLKGKTIITVAHRISTIKDYDLIIVLEKGKIVEQGDYERLMNNKNVFYSLVLRGEKNDK